MKRRMFLGSFAAGLTAIFLAGATSGCSSKTRKTNFRLTVSVQTPQGLKTGVSVVQLLLRDNNSPFVLPDARGIRTAIRGEAVAVELGEGRVLFALLKDLDPALRQGKIYAREVERAEYPMMVTFGDVDNPTSVAEVDPDDLSSSFGEGYALKRITVQVTDEPVTTGIEKRLGWFRERAKAGGGLIPMVKNDQGRWEAAPGYDASLVEIGLSNFSTEAYKF